MAETQTIASLGDAAIDFDLQGVDGRRYGLDAAAGPRGTVVMFICNHCPYVRSAIARIVEDCTALQANGVGAIAIMPNDTVRYPQDGFDEMKRFAAAHGFTFPYVIDETQDVTRAYGAKCTPDFFGFNGDRLLQYRGRLDAGGARPAPDARRDLLEAMRLVAETGHGPTEQMPSQGCSIKWRAVA